MGQDISAALDAALELYTLDDAVDRIMDYAVELGIGQELPRALKSGRDVLDSSVAVHLDDRDWDLLAPEDWGYLFESSLQYNPKKRSKTGAHYTPMDMAADTVLWAMAPQVDSAVSFCDPAMGCGVFLIAAYRELLKRKVYPDDAVGLVHGVDINPAAVRMARVCLWIEAGMTEWALECVLDNLKCGDSLLGFDWAEWEDFDVVAGNPPFLGGMKISSAYGDQYLKELKAAYPADRYGTADLAAYFFRLAARLVGPNGSFGLVSTNSISEGDTRILGLKHLITKEAWEIYRAEKDKKWPGTAAVTISIVYMSKADGLYRGIKKELICH